MVSAGTREHYRRDRSGEDLEVEPERPAIDVEQVAFDPQVELGFLTRLDLPQPGDARLHAESTAVPRVIPLHLVLARRTGPTRLISPFSDVPELRQLVEARPAKEGAETGDPRIVRSL